MWMILFPESSVSRVSKVVHRCIHSKERHPRVGPQSHLARRSMFEQKFNKQKEWSSKCTVLEVEEQVSKGVLCSGGAELQGLGPRDFPSCCFLYLCQVRRGPLWYLLWTIVSTET